MNNSSQHFSFAELADCAEGRSETAQQTASSSHITNCRHCANELERLKRVINVMRTDSNKDAPPDVIAHAVNSFRGGHESREAPVARRIVAALSFDSFNLASVFGVRSGPATSRQLVYAAEENSLDLRIATEGEFWTVSGQVLGANCAGGSIELQAEDGPAASAVLNDLCEFTLSPVPPGSYRLRLRLANFEVEVPSLNLQA